VLTNTNHFYKDDLKKYSDYLKNKDESVISFLEFNQKFMSNYNNIKDIILYITNIENNLESKNYNVIKVFHLFLMLFLNKYGLDYHKTDNKKFNNLKYKIKIKKGLANFLIKNKVEKESKKIINLFDLKKDIKKCKTLLDY